MLKLREIEIEDMSTINEWRNDESLISSLGAPFRFINIDVDKEWYESYLKSRFNTVRCVIVDTDKQEEILGLISLTDINNINQSATLHLMIGEEKNRKKGIGTFSIKKMLEHAFYNLNLRRVELSVLSTNQRAISLYTRMGFNKEGIKKQAVYKNGCFVDIDIMAILKN